jgi:hypothetical protein
VAVFDEQVIGYQPSHSSKNAAEKAGHSIPVVYIPRKPHPNGLLIYVVCLLTLTECQLNLYQVATMVESPVEENATLPYILDLLPHLQVSDISPVESLKLGLERWGTISKPHIVADAAFGSVEMLAHITGWGGTATFSCASGSSSWLWELLSHNLPALHWRAAVHHPSGYVASLHTAQDKGKTTHQQLLSSGWSAFAKVLVNADSSASSGVPPLMPKFTKDTLSKMTVKELHDICKKYHIKVGKAKAGYVHNIVQRSDTLHKDSDLVESLQRSLHDQYMADPAPLHDFYKDNFNFVDLADRRWYSVEEHHQHQRWQTKMILAILRTAVSNTWVYATKFEYQPWLSWRTALSLELLKK